VKTVWRTGLRPGPSWGSLHYCPRLPSLWQAGWLPLLENSTPALGHASLELRPFRPKFLSPR